MELLSCNLCGRTESVKANAITGNIVETNAGVPQGAGLGPVLFLVHMNSILDMKMGGKITYFSDNIAVLFNSGSYGKAINQANEGLELIRR